MRHGHVALDDRYVARQSRFRCQKIVVVRVDLVDGRVVADMKEFPLGVVEELPVHAAHFFVRTGGEGEKLAGQRARVLFRAPKRLVEAKRRCVERG